MFSRGLNEEFGHKVEFVRAPNPAVLGLLLAVGRETEASRYRENMQNHFMYGNNARLPEHIKALGSTA